MEFQVLQLPKAEAKEPMDRRMEYLEMQRRRGEQPNSCTTLLEIHLNDREVVEKYALNFSLRNCFLGLFDGDAWSKIRMRHIISFGKKLMAAPFVFPFFCQATYGVAAN